MLVVVAKSHEELLGFPQDSVLGVVDELVLLANPGARYGGPGHIGNHALESSRCDVVGLVHADTSFGVGTLRSFAEAASGGAVVGLVGRAIDGAYIWSRDVIEPAAVSTLDSSSVFIPRRSGLRFDTETFGGFHCCVEDICLSAQKAGMRVLVPPGPANHTGTNWPGNQQWMADYGVARATLARKWAGVEFHTT
jgi:hypothetical protein